MNSLLLILFLLSVGTGAELAPVATIEDDVIMHIGLPEWGTVCIASDVRGGPDASYPVLYSVLVGERVRIHDQSRPDGTWVSIHAARWVPLKNICFDER